MRTFIKPVIFDGINKELEAIIRTSSVLAKLKGKDNSLINLLEEEYKKDPLNIDKVSAYCFYLWFLADDSLDLSDTNSIFQLSFNVINLIEDVLEERPEYWILWILKYRIQSFMNFNEEELIGNLKGLISNQQLTDYPSYFLTSHLLLSHVYYLKGLKEEAIASLTEISSLYQTRIGILKEFFRGFIKEYRNLLKRSNEDDILSLLNKIEEKYF